MSAATDNKKLLRLYQIWSERGQFRSVADESEAFFSWLSEQYQNILDIEGIETSDPVLEFLQSSEHLADNVVTGRLEPRCNTHIATLIRVLGEAEGGASSQCHAIDVGVHGVRLLSDSYLLDLSRVRLDVSPVDSVYRLEGDTRWTDSSDEGFLIGIQLVETEDFERWQEDFETRFGEQLK